MQADVFRALADPTRRAIITMLSQKGPMPAGDIASAFDVSRPAIAKHMAVLQQSGVVLTKKQGRQRINILNPESLISAADWIKELSSFWEQRLVDLKVVIEEEET